LRYRPVQTAIKTYAAEGRSVDVKGLAFWRLGYHFRTLRSGRALARGILLRHGYESNSTFSISVKSSRIEDSEAYATKMTNPCNSHYVEWEIRKEEYYMETWKGETLANRTQVCTRLTGKISIVLGSVRSYFPGCGDVNRRLLTPLRIIKYCIGIVALQVKDPRRYIQINIYPQCRSVQLHPSHYVSTNCAVVLSRTNFFLMADYSSQGYDITAFRVCSSLLFR
jgi:hypothetical protein